MQISSMERLNLSSFRARKRDTIRIECLAAVVMASKDFPSESSTLLYNAIMKHPFFCVGANAATCVLNNPGWFYFATMERARIFTMLTVITDTSGEQ